MLSGSPPPRAEGFLDAFRDGFNGCGMRIALGPLSFMMPKGAWLKACSKVHQFANVYVDRAIAYREKLGDPTDRQQTAKERTLLFNMAQQTADRTVLRNQVIQAMMAATETTASLVVHVIRNLARHSDVFKQVRAEVLALGDTLLDFDRLSRLSALQHAVTESMFFRDLQPLLKTTANTLQLYACILYSPRTIVSP